MNGIYGVTYSNIAVMGWCAHSSEENEIGIICELNVCSIRKNDVFNQALTHQY